MYAILDIETTGGKFNEEGITEIAIHRYDGNQVEDTFISLINPEREIQPFVRKLTGIDEKMVRSAPKFHQVAKRIVEITQGAILVAHNAQFDYRILRTEFRRLGYEFERQTLCTVDLSKQLLPDADSHSLGKLVRSLGIPVSNRHRANGDALATLKLFEVLLSKDSQKTILRNTIRAASLGELSHRQLKLVETTPSSTGVYYFVNKDGEIIFIGYHSDMKKAVNIHFTKDHKTARKIQKEVREVKYEVTGSELLALVKHELEVKKNRPLYNQTKKQAREKPVGEMVVNGTHYPLFGKDLLIIDKGREAGEQSALRIRDGRLSGIGFFSLNHQINNIHILDSLLTAIDQQPEVLGSILKYLAQKRVQRVMELES